MSYGKIYNYSKITSELSCCLNKRKMLSKKDLSKNM